MPTISPPLQTVPTLLPATGLALASTNETSPLNWGSNPDYRGTLNILFGCLTTLVLCSWTVLHLDIPTRQEGRVTKFTRKLGWFCVALFAPHILVIIAYNQRYAAKLMIRKTQEYPVQFPEPPPSRSQRLFCSLRQLSQSSRWHRLYRNLRQLLSEYSPLGSSGNPRTRNEDQQSHSEPVSISGAGWDQQQFLDWTCGVTSTDSSDESRPVNSADLKEEQRPKALRQHAWGMRYAFYACMGGYAFDFGGPEEPAFLPCGDKRITITPVGIAFLLKRYPDLIPDISVESIEDRSKSDALAKAIVIVQVLWFCVNFVARMASNLPVSLLEVATIAHAISALVIYILWWDKPHDIALPTLITGSQAREVCALMSMVSPSCRPVMAGLWTFTSHSEFAKPLEYSGNTEFRDASPVMLPGSDSHTITVSPERRVFGFSIRITQYSTLHSPSDWTILRKLADLRFYLLFGPQSSGRRPWYVYPWISPDNDSFTLSRVDLRRWLLASNALAAAESYPERYFEPLVTRHSSPAYFFRHLSGFSWMDGGEVLLERMAEEYRYNIAVAASLALYGAPHLLGWNAKYPLLVERLLWQASVVTLLSPITLVLFLRLIDVLDIDLPDVSFLGVDLSDIFGYFVGYSFVGLGSLLLLLYPVASAYLVVESFRQLLFLPDAAFQIPSWSEIWPHVS